MRIQPKTLKYFVDSEKNLNRIGDFPAEMTDKEALEDCIEKWQTLVSYYSNPKNTTGPVADPDSCALCHKYWEKSDYPCRECPIAIQTGEPYCEKTPLATLKDMNLEIATKEVQFLKDILASLPIKSKR